MLLIAACSVLLPLHAAAASFVAWSPEYLLVCPSAMMMSTRSSAAGSRWDLNWAATAAIAALSADPTAIRGRRLPSQGRPSVLQAQRQNAAAITTWVRSHLEASKAQP